MTKVLLTGGSGFIAAHILEKLLERGQKVVTTVRSEEKAQKIRDAHGDLGEDRLKVVVVPDIAREDAFDEVVREPGLEAVLHTASPFHFNWTDPQKELIDPAVIGTTSILKALHTSAPSVTHVVITSSFASIIDEAHLADPTIYTEKSWNPVTLADIHRSPATAYRASKTLAERAAWAFMQTENPAFALTTVCPPLVLGPVVHHMATLANINTSNARVLDLLGGKWKGGIPATGAAYLWIDVRDCAEAHVRALERAGARGRRLFTTAGYFCNAEIARVLRGKFPEFEDRLPEEGVEGGEMPGEGKVYGYDASETEGILGIEWVGLERSMVDLVETLKGFDI